MKTELWQEREVSYGKRERAGVCLLEQRIELILTRARLPHSVPQIWNLIAGTDPEEVETKDVQPLIKTET